MTITEYYKNYKTNKKYPHTLTHGSAETVEEFFQNCIAKHILPVDYVLKWHEMLLEYVKRDDAVFWVRYHESGTRINGRWNTRRGCKVTFKDGISIVYVSNYDAHEIFNMVRLGVVPGAEEFANLMNSHKFPLHYDSGKSCEESDICCYPHIGSTKAGILTSGHWYLAHIIGVRSDFYGSEVAADAEKIYPRGELSDWKPDRDGFPVKQLDYSLSDDEKKLVKAHFLRFVDPLNYYVVPGKNYQINDMNNHQIGEAAIMNDYVSNKFAEIYGAEALEDFRKLVFAWPSVPKVDGSTPVKIEYSPIAVDKKTSSAFTAEEALHVAAVFLKNDLSLIKIEETIMNLSGKKGWTAKKILDTLGVTNDKKGLLARSDIDSEIAKATGVFKETLEEIKKRGL